MKSIRSTISELKKHLVKLLSHILPESEEWYPSSYTFLLNICDSDHLDASYLTLESLQGEHHDEMFSF